MDENLELLEQFADQHNISYDVAKEYWDRALAVAADANKDKDSPDYYAYVRGTMKRLFKERDFDSSVHVSEMANSVAFTSAKKLLAKSGIRLQYVTEKACYNVNHICTKHPSITDFNTDNLTEAVVYGKQLASKVEE